MLRALRGSRSVTLIRRSAAGPGRPGQYTAAWLSSCSRSCCTVPGRGPRRARPVLGAQPPGPGPRPGRGRAGQRRGAARAPAAARPAGGSTPSWPAVTRSAASLVRGGRAQAVERRRALRGRPEPGPDRRLRHAAAAAPAGAGPRVLRVPGRLHGAWQGSTEPCAERPTCTTPPSTAWHPCDSSPRASHARLFTGERRAEFMDFLRSRLASGAPGAPYADAVPELARRAEPAAAGGGRRTRSGTASSSSCWISSSWPSSWSCTPPRRARADDAKTVDHRDRRPRQRQERHRPVAARRARAPGRTRPARDRLPVLHPDPAEGRGPRLDADAAPVQVLQQFVDRRAQRPGRPDPATRPTGSGRRRPTASPRPPTVPAGHRSTS